MKEIEGHIPNLVQQSGAWKAECSCGTFAIGYFPSAAAAKRAFMNIDHTSSVQSVRADTVLEHVKPPTMKVINSGNHAVGEKKRRGRPQGSKNKPKGINSVLNKLKLL